MTYWLPILCFAILVAVVGFIIWGVRSDMREQKKIETRRRELLAQWERERRGKQDGRP